MANDERGDDRVIVDIDVQPGGLMFGPLTIKDVHGNTVLSLEPGAFIRGNVPDNDRSLGVSST